MTSLSGAREADGANESASWAAARHRVQPLRIVRSCVQIVPAGRAEPSVESSCLRFA